MRGRFGKGGIKVFLLCLLIVVGLNRVIPHKHLSKIESLEARLKREPHNLSVILSLANSYYKKAIHLSSPIESPLYLKAAISLYKKALKIKKDPKIAFYLGRAYFNIAKYSNKKEVDKFYSLSCENLLFSYSSGFVSNELFILLGHIYLIQKNFPKAIEFYEKCLKSSRKDPIALLNLAFCYKESEELDKALQYLKMIDEPQEKELSCELHLQLGEIYEKKGLSLLARREYLSVLEKDKKNEKALMAIKRLG